MAQDVRLEQLKQWVHSLPNWQNAEFTPASFDASFRRYFRATQGQQTAIVMDAPPAKESCTEFVDITDRLLKTEVRVPRLLAKDMESGFLLMEDFGSTLLLDQLNPANVDQYYTQAMQSLLTVQQAPIEGLPVYGTDLLMQEMELMPEWFLRTHLQMPDSAVPVDMLQTTLTVLAREVVGQPSTFVHRDYHSRNLMVLADGELGIIDYQDAVLGPITYDLVSLLRDCYIAWSERQVQQWAVSFLKQAVSLGNIPPTDEQTFLRWFDLTGLQRHIKVLGVFSRLSHRDGKNHFLDDLPLVLNYVLKVGARHPETVSLVEWLHDTGIAGRVGTVNSAD